MNNKEQAQVCKKADKHSGKPPWSFKKNCNGLGNIVQKLKKICILPTLVSLPYFNQHDEDTKEELSILKKAVEDKNGMSKTKKDSKKYAKKCLIYNEKMATLTK